MSTISNDTMRGEYVSGEGFEAGNVAPSTKYADMNGKLSDSEPVGGGHVIVFKGDRVSPSMAAVIAAGSDASDASDDDSDETKPYAKWRKAALVDEIEKRNADRDDDDKLDASGTVPQLAALLDADDAPSE